MKCSECKYFSGYCTLEREIYLEDVQEEYCGMYEKENKGEEDMNGFTIEEFSRRDRWKDSIRLR